MGPKVPEEGMVKRGTSKVASLSLDARFLITPLRSLLDTSPSTLTSPPPSSRPGFSVRIAGASTLSQRFQRSTWPSQSTAAKVAGCSGCHLASHT